MTTTPPKIKRSETKEAYRLWFEFLKRALTDKSVTVNRKLYVSWGDVGSYAFDRWWREIGSEAIQLGGKAVTLVKTASHDDKNAFLVSVPKSLTSTDAANKLRKLLIDLNHTPIRTGKGLRVNDSVELRFATYRGWLHTYDCNRKLIDEIEKASGKRKPLKGRQLLAAVRKFYLERSERLKNANRRIDALPHPLFTGGAEVDADKIDVLASATAISAVLRYLDEANKLIANVAIGKFPS